MPELARGVERVVLDDDRAEAQDRIERDHMLRTVRQHQRHPVALRDPQVPETLRGAVDLLSEVAVCRDRAEELEGGTAGVPPDARRQHLGQRLRRLLDVGGHIFRIGAEPGAGGQRRIGHAPILR
ncbi:Uncharacterised protein [Mycobacterium tuberculosis]|nr:Uncharacterised protein [Mycobacterium tuberculosis]